MANGFKSNVGSKISKKEAEDWIAKYDSQLRKDKKLDTKSIFYGRDALLQLLSKEGSTGITFYLALKPNEDGKESVNLVLVATREDGTKIWDDDAPVAKMAVASSAYDNGSTCPPYC